MKFLALITNLLLSACTSAASPSTQATHDRLETIEYPAPPTFVLPQYRVVWEGWSGDQKNLDALLQRLPDSVTLQRTICFGNCPAYIVTFRRDSVAELDALDYMPLSGKFHARIAPGDYARLCYLLETLDFKNLQPRYRANWTDDSTCYVTVTKGATSKTVEDYGTYGPIQLWAIQQTIDHLRERMKWEPGPAAPLAPATQPQTQPQSGANP